ncbi:RNase J family beta-CASP ribonuclease [Candidatus Woesearchaeota archaeon]|nr:RNase J family beta-CASP ribonuclease [Candidatus Woesearchaeota archaeon]
MVEVELFAIGGFTEITKNMTAVRVDDEIVILDMGIYLPAFIDYQEEGGKIDELNNEEIIKMGAIPNDHILDRYRQNVKGIFLGHAHLDHIAAVPFLASNYDCKIYGSPFTIEIVKAILREHKRKLKNKLIPTSLNSTVKVSANIQVELIAITHSTSQCALLAVHTPKGVILYCNDFKLDNTPTLGNKPNYERLEELGSQGALAVITETMYAEKAGKCPSERVAKEMLREVMLEIDHKDKALFVTTFASHIARIKSTIEFGLKLNRQIVILGRSMEKYITAAQNLRLLREDKRVKVYTYRSAVERILNEISKRPGKYLVICTGSQGEPNSILDKIVNGKVPFQFQPDDRVIFSTKTIPVESNIENRERLESKLKKRKIRMYLDIHVSGHSASEDLRELLNMTKPKHIIPAQGEPHMIDAFMEICKHLNFKPKQIHRVEDGTTIKL